MSARWRRLRAEDAGFTLVELLVSIVLLSILLAALTTTVFAAQRSAEMSIQDHTRTEEARLAANRVSRELRQALQIDRVVNPMGAGYNADAISVVTFRADFNGNGCVNGVMPDGGTPPVCASDDPVADPEIISYCHEPAAVAGNVPRLYVVGGALPASITSCSAGQPILAEQVDGFGIEYRSSEYRLDANADGVTSWEELDAGLPPYGNGNGILDGTTNSVTGDAESELAYIDSVVVHIDLDDGDGREFRTQLALRNRTS